MRVPLRIPIRVWSWAALAWLRGWARWVTNGGAQGEVRAIEPRVLGALDSFRTPSRATSRHLRVLGRDPGFLLFEGCALYLPVPVRRTKAKGLQ